MNQVAQSQPVKKTTPLMRRVVIYAALPLVFFLLGFVPLWVKSYETSLSLSRARHELSLAQMQNSLGSAVIDAQRGDYEPALLSASNFYTSLRAETDSGEASALSPAQSEAVQRLFTEQDEIITLLARRDPAAADRLSDLYVSYRQILNR